MTLPDTFTDAIESCLNQLGDYSLSRPHQLAKSIKELSDWYHRSSEQTVDLWSRKDLSAGYLAYYFPLNYLRARFVYDKALEHIELPTELSVLDFGSGSGAASLAFADALSKENVQLNISFYDSSEKAIQLHSQLASYLNQKNTTWTSLNSSSEIKPSYDLGLFSYVLNELKQVPDVLKNSTTSLIVEPSTQLTARRLMELRKDFIESGSYILAPCTHQAPCPLLTHSNTDWCHLRLPVEMPNWFKDIEKLLPMKNQTLTLSFLAVSKQPSRILSQEATPSTRVLGATQKEKGKTKQLICRSKEREFLAWLKKNKNEQYLASGQRTRLDEKNYELKSNEVRPSVELELLKG